MADSTYNEPRLALNRIYTRRGDTGETALVGGQRVLKHNLRIECYGTIDELNSFIGMAGISAAELLPHFPDLSTLASILKRIQHELFNLGSILATLPEDVHPKQPRVSEEDIAQLEQEIDKMNAVLPTLRSFVLPGGNRLNTELHVCRTICRRAERLAVSLSQHEPCPPEAVQYLNRLSDAFFVFSRWANHITGTEETLWQPNLSASGRKTL